MHYGSFLKKPCTITKILINYYIAELENTESIPCKVYAFLPRAPLIVHAPIYVVSIKSVIFYEAWEFLFNFPPYHCWSRPQ
jgi:hypothetical protein